jgi:tetratricopeptide (TPR) repeat protein
MKNCRFCIAALLLAFLPQASAGPWKMASTQHYQLFSQLEDSDSRAWMRGFDQFILSTSSALNINIGALPPLTVVLFKRDKDYTPYKLLRPNGQVAPIAGQFARRATWSVVGMARDSDNEELQRTIHHEATHWLMSGDQERQPAWFSEGIAELFSTFERRGDKVNWAKPIGPHLYTLNQIGTMKLADFLTESSAIFDKDSHTDRFYAQSWAFTHYLMFSNEQKRRPLLVQFLREFKSNSGEATVEKVFGAQLPELEKDFHSYITQRRYVYMALPVKAAPEPPALQPAPEAIVEAALGFLALGANRTELARQHAMRANELDPAIPGGHEILAYLALDKDAFDEAATHAEAALRRGSRDSDQFLIQGDSYVRGRNADKPDADRLRVNMYENAINLNPRRQAGYQRLSEALLNTDKPREEDARFLALGLRAFPGDDWLKLGAAIVDYRLGRRDSARATLEAVLRVDGTLDGQQRNFAQQVRRGWLVDDMNRELDEARSRRDARSGRAIVARYRQLLGEDRELDRYLLEVDASLELQELMERMDAAQRAGRRAEARQLAEQILKRQDLPVELRDGLQRMLRGR